MVDMRDAPFGAARQPVPARHPGDPRVAPPPARNHHARQPARGGSGGAEGNKRLTALTGAVLLLLLAAEGLTILQLRSMLTLHFFIGMLLLGPVALKAGSTIYRFARYYTGSAPYRRKGPPSPLLRLLGPVVVAATVGVFGTGVALALAGPAGLQPWLFLHKGSFVVWFGAMTVHVLAYLPRLPGLLAAEFGVPRRPDTQATGYAVYGGHRTDGGLRGDAGYRGDGGYVEARPVGRAASVLGGRGVRLFLLTASLLAGLVIAVLTVHLAAPWQFAGLSQ
jgi:hypothetical protein